MRIYEKLESSWIQQAVLIRAVNYFLQVVSLCSLACCRSILRSPSFLLSFRLRLFLSFFLSLFVFCGSEVLLSTLSLSSAFGLDSSISLDFKALKQVSKSRPQKNSSPPPPPPFVALPLFHASAARDRRGSRGCKSARDLRSSNFSSRPIPLVETPTTMSARRSRVEFMSLDSAKHFMVIIWSSCSLAPGWGKYMKKK